MNRKIMLAFEDLPLELLPLIVQHVVKASHLAALCLVDQSFYRFTVPLLYEKAIIFPWYRDAKAKMMQLFNTLAHYPHLAALVRKLEIRDFPKALYTAEAYQTLLDDCVRGIQNSVHLRSCTWTRDGSLTTPILEALRTCPELHELEINGHHDDNYEPHMLTSFKNLTKISLIMPSNPVVSVLPQWLGFTGHSLRNLTLICKSSPLITDDFLNSLSPHLTNLEHLYLVGCSRVTHVGAWTVVSTNSKRLVGLGLEGLSPSFDMQSFGDNCRSVGGLPSLKYITVTVPPICIPDKWTAGVIETLSESPLEAFHLYALYPQMDAPPFRSLCSQIIAMHGHSLMRFSVHRLRVGLDLIGDVCIHCPNLQQLFMLLKMQDLGKVGEVLAHGTKLRAIHVNIVPAAGVMPTRLELAKQFVARCSPTLTQLGIDTQVWQVLRQAKKREDGSVTTEPVLTKYENPEVPEQFMVSTSSECEAALDVFSEVMSIRQALLVEAGGDIAVSYNNSIDKSRSTSFSLVAPRSRLGRGLLTIIWMRLQRS